MSRILKKKNNNNNLQSVSEIVKGHLESRSWNRSGLLCAEAFIVADQVLVAPPRTHDGPTTKADTITHKIERLCQALYTFKQGFASSICVTKSV